MRTRQAVGELARPDDARSIEPSVREASAACAANGLQSFSGGTQLPFLFLTRSGRSHHTQLGTVAAAREWR
jgi:hypothetical protein